jgi:hypothetical protein
MEIDQNLQINMVSCPSKRLLFFRNRRVCFLTITYFKYLPYIFHVKNQLFLTLKSDQDPDPHGSALVGSLDPELDLDSH